MARHYLSTLFEPGSVALFGASERQGSLGAIVYDNLVADGLHGSVYPVNPGHKTIRGNRCYPSLEAVSAPVDLAVIATPAASIPGIMYACVQHGVKAAVILSAGFRETGAEGKRLEDEVTETAKRHGLRFIGPNSLGIMRPRVGLNATFAKGCARPGKLALVSQSGAICTAVLDWAESKGIGFSTVVSMGISADIDFGEVLDYLVHDPHTESILLYIEGIQNARGFMSALRAAARAKPVIVLKVGRHDSGSRAALSHTGALVGSDDVFDAALRRAGVVRGERIGHLFTAASVLACDFRLGGDSLAIVTNGGGPGAMAADRAGDLGVRLAELDATTMQALSDTLPGNWSHANPVDVIGDAPPQRFAAAVEQVLADKGVHGVLVILTPQPMTDPAAVAESLVGLLKRHGKPLLACWMGEVQVQQGREILNAAGIPVFNTPETAIEAFAFLTSYYRNQQLLLQTPGPMSDRSKADVVGARMIIEAALGEDRSVLSETESMSVLRAFRIPTVTGVVARSANEALVEAETLGFPVVLKIHSPDITHKSDVGGVRLNVPNAQAVRGAYQELISAVQASRPQARIDGVVVESQVQKANARELLLGVSTDPVFGPVITFGAGGSMAEVMADRAVGLPPLNTMLIDDLLVRTRVSKVLGVFRQMPAANLDALRTVLWRLSEMVCELPHIRELDINPLLLDEREAMAVDARIVVDFAPAGRPAYDHMAIHPYPAYLENQLQLDDGTCVLIRPIRPEDARIEHAFVKGLSARSKYFRFMHTLDELTPAMLARFTQLDYDREMALIAVITEAGEEKEIAVARYITNPDASSCEFAIVTADEWQHRGIAHRLMDSLMQAARSRGLARMEGEVLATNSEMLSMVKRLGFTVSVDPDDPGLRRVERAL